MLKVTLFAVILLWSKVIFGQNLYVGSDSYLAVEQGAKLAVNGLVLSPTSDFVLPSQTAIERKGEPANTGNTAIQRQYIFSRPLLGYTGEVLFFYEDSELNGLDEEDLTLQLLDVDLLWYPYIPRVDRYANRLSYSFGSAVNFSVITADYLEPIGYTLETAVAYPNPTYNSLQIQYPYSIRTTLSSMSGQVLQQGYSSEMDLSAYQSGVYFLTIEDSKTNLKKTIKIVKL
jgi:hypothetical protein